MSKMFCFLSRLLLIGAATFSIPALAQSQNQTQTRIDQNGVHVGGAVIDDYVFYNIGGGRAVMMNKTANMQSWAVGAGWNSNLICGDMSLEMTLQNQLNGLTRGFQTIMSSVIQNATSAVASLPALIIQRANPALYNLMTNGILQARLDYDRSKLTCRAISEKMAEVAEGQLGWNQLSLESVHIHRNMLISCLLNEVWDVTSDTHR